MKPNSRDSNPSRSSRTRSKQSSQPREYGFVDVIYEPNSGHQNGKSSKHSNHHRRQQTSSHQSHGNSTSGHRSDGERMKKKFRDAIYVGNFERVARIIKNILDNQTLDLTSVLLPYASRHVTPIGLAARRGHVQICRVLVEVIKEYVIKKQTETNRTEHEIDMEIVAEHETMLEILSREEGRAENTSSAEKEEQKGTEEDEQQEVEDNGVVNDDSSSSISPQPVEQKKQIVSFSTLPNEKEALLAINKLNNNNDDDNDVNMGESNAPQNNVNEYIADKKRSGKRRKKKSSKVIRSSSSDRLMMTDDSIPPSVGNEISEDMMMKNEFLRNGSGTDVVKVVRYHRKSQSMPYMQMHLHEMLNRMDGENRTALSHACEKGQKEVIEFLLSEDGIAIEEGGKHHEESWTNLHWACRYGHHEIVQLLLNKGADINAQTSKKKSTGLHLACATGHTEVIRVLLENDAAKEIEDVYGCSPLSLAIHFGEKKVQQILYEAGIAVSPHDARRLKKDNHIFRRFHWIKIPPSISTKIVLPDDMWCIVCGFLPCDELLLNVRLVSFGFLYVVHHPALRKLVNFKRSLPENPDELVQYNEGHQTLVLKAPSPESNFNVNAAPFAFLPPNPLANGAVGFAPPPAAAAILGGAAAHHGLHGGNGIAHPHGAAPPPHTGTAAGALTQMNNGAVHGAQPNPFGSFPHYIIPPPHHSHGAQGHPPSYPTAHQPLNNDNNHNTNTTTTTSMNNDQDLVAQLQIAHNRNGYIAQHYRNFLRPNAGRTLATNSSNDSSNFDMLAQADSTSTPTNKVTAPLPLAIGSRPSNHVTFDSADFCDEDEKDNDGDEDEFTPPSFGGQTMTSPLREGLRNTQSVVRAVEEEWMGVGGHLNINLDEAPPILQIAIESHDRMRQNAMNIDRLNNNNNHSNINDNNNNINDSNDSGDMNAMNVVNAPPSKAPINVGTNDGDQDESSQSELQMSEMNGQLASLIFHHVTPPQEDIDENNHPPTHSMQRQPSEELQQAPVPSDFADLRDIEPLTNLEPQSSDSLLQSLLPMGGDHAQAVLNANPTPMTRASSQVTANTQQHPRFGNNLQTIHYRQRSMPASNALPSLVPENVCDTNINGFPVSMNGINGLPGISAPPLLSRNYSHNNFVQANSDFQRLFARTPPISPSFGRSQTQSGINSNSVSVNSGHNSLNTSPRHPLVSPVAHTHFSDFRQHLSRGMPPSQASPENENENANVNDDGDDSMMQIDTEEEQRDTVAMPQDGNNANGGQWREQAMMTMTNPMLQNNPMDHLFFGTGSQHQSVSGGSPQASNSGSGSPSSSSVVMCHTRDSSGNGWAHLMPVPPRYVPDNSNLNGSGTEYHDNVNAASPSRNAPHLYARRHSPSPSDIRNEALNLFHSTRRRGYGSMDTRSLLMHGRLSVMERLEELNRIRGDNMDNDEEMSNDEECLMMDNGDQSPLEEKEDEDASDSLADQSWQYKHCLWLACAVNFGPSNLRKIRLTGVSILSQPLIRVLSCLSFIVHLELAHFHAYTLTTMDLKQLSRVSQLKMIRQLKVFPVIRNNSYRAAMYDACAVATFITQIGSTALTLGIKYESIEIDEAEEKAIAEHMKRFDAHILSANEHGNSPKVKAIECPKTESDSKSKSAKVMVDDSKEKENEVECQEEAVLDVDSTDVDTARLSSLTWKSLFDHLPSNLRSLRLHFGKDDSLKRGAVHGLKNFESIKCFTLHGDPGLYGQIEEWSDVFKRWNKLRYIVLGHRNNTKELQVPKEILNALPPMLPELALNISVHSIPNVVWYLKHVVRAECFLRINLHVVHKHKSDLYHASIHPEIIPCLTRFHNLETAYLKCGMVTLEQIELLLQRCIKVSFVGFGIDASDEKQVMAFRLLLEDYGFDKIVVKNKLNWLIAVKSYDKLLLDPTRCIHPVLEAFDEKSCQIMSTLKRMGPKGKSAMALHSRTDSQIQSLDD